MRLALERIAERGAIVQPDEIRVEWSTLQSLIRRGLVKVDDAGGLERLETWYLLTDAGRRALAELE